MGMKISKKNQMNVLIICNPCINLSQKEIENHTGQMNDLKLIMGGFNAHHTSLNPKLNVNTITKQSKIHLK